VPVEGGGIAAVTGGHVRRVWLGLAAAGLAPDDEADVLDSSMLSILVLGTRRTPLVAFRMPSL
jgi:hypothetical protein